jgi:NADH:ubiquinone oxidoreductase subunit 3 (subunit A)
MSSVLLSPPVVIGAFIGLAYALYRLGGRLAARGRDAPGKHQPYACGEEIPPPKAQLTYHAFFRLALMFGILHLATIVLSTLPFETVSHRLAIAYLVAIGISVLSLTEGEL